MPTLVVRIIGFLPATFDVKLSQPVGPNNWCSLVHQRLVITKMFGAKGFHRGQGETKANMLRCPALSRAEANEPCSSRRTRRTRSVETDNPAPDPHIRLVTVFETSDVGVVAIAKSVLEEADIDYTVQGESLRNVLG
jgi:hypothetical protein